MAGATGETPGDAGDALGATGAVSRLKGRLFEGVTLLCTLFGITVVAALLAYVANDAIRPATADTAWLLTFAGTVVAPAVVLAAYYYLRDPAGGVVAYESLGVPVVGLVAGGGLIVLFVELISPAGWTALVLSLVVAAAVVVAHRRLRPAAAVERLVVVVLAPPLALFGIPPLAMDFTLTGPLSGTEVFTIAFATPALLPSLSDLFLAVPLVHVGWPLLVVTITIPVAGLLGRLVARRREDGRGVRETVGGAVLVAGLGALTVPQFGLAAEHWVLLVTAALVPTGVYLEGVLRRGRGVSGLAMPVVLVGGTVLGLVVVDALAAAGPDVWLDWSFLTSPHSRTPADAGIYPALVGTVMIMVVMIVAIFPVGVGAAIYLEEYAPDSGFWGRVVGIIEINIGNLAGVPSVVYGLLGLALFIRGIGLESGIVIVGGLTVGLLILPIVIISAQEAIRAVPDSSRRASYGMGATKWQTVRNVVLPQALPGILTGTIIALGRAIGETAPLLMIGIASSVRLAPGGFFDKTSAMPRQIFSWSSEFDPDFRFGVLAAGVITLVVVLLLMNGAAIVIRNKHQRS
jgi:phosphate transport system permease protein